MVASGNFRDIRLSQVAARSGTKPNSSNRTARVKGSNMVASPDEVSTQPIIQSNAANCRGHGALHCGLVRDFAELPSDRRTAATKTTGGSRRTIAVSV